MKTPSPTIGKFQDSLMTADGVERAVVRLTNPRTLWFNTGTLCNIACAHCYINSSPTNDTLIYLSVEEVQDYLDQLIMRDWGVCEIGFTGGEPFMNPGLVEMAEAALCRGYRVLVLTNAMQPMMRRSVRAGLGRLRTTYGNRLTLRVSLDHFDPVHHDRERGEGSFAKAIEGMQWLRDTGIRTTVAGRTLWNESETDLRAGFAELFARHRFDINAGSPDALVLFPEMEETGDVPEISVACWDVLGRTPESVMCASSRMVVKRKGAKRPVVVACTLLPHAPEFELGETLEAAEREIRLNHPHCARFCVLGGATCSSGPDRPGK